MRVLLRVANIISIKGLLEVLIASGIFILNSGFMYLFHILRGSIPRVIPYVFQQYAVNADSLYGSISVPSAYLQNLLTHPAFVAAAIWVWSTYFPVVFFAPSIIYLLRLRFTAQYIIAQVLVIMLGLFIYATLPTPPPGWL